MCHFGLIATPKKYVGLLKYFKPTWRKPQQNQVAKATWRLRTATFPSSKVRAPRLHDDVVPCVSAMLVGCRQVATSLHFAPRVPARSRLGLEDAATTESFRRTHASCPTRAIPNFASIGCALEAATLEMCPSPFTQGLGFLTFSPLAKRHSVDPVGLTCSSPGACFSHRSRWKPLSRVTAFV